MSVLSCDYLRAKDNDHSHNTLRVKAVAYLQPSKSGLEID